MSGSVRHSLESSQKLTECQWQNIKKVDHFHMLPRVTQFIETHWLCNSRFQKVTRTCCMLHAWLMWGETYPNSYWKTHCNIIFSQFFGFLRSKNNNGTIKCQQHHKTRHGKHSWITVTQMSETRIVTQSRTDEIWVTVPV